MNRRGIFTAAVAASTLAVPMIAAPVAPVQAAATYTTALYEMNEPAGSTVLVDSSGNGLNGTIGTEVQTNASYQGAVGHRYAYLAPDTPPAHPQHLDKVNDNTLLDPGTSDYAVNIRYRTTRSFGNLIQKGQNADNGGYFKIELPAGNITCLYKDSTGRQRAMTSPLKYNDGNWHIIRCERYGQNQINMYVDGVRIFRITGAMTNINNSKNLSIAGKSACDQVTVSCDYFVGDIDWVRIEKGTSGPVTNPPPTARFTESCTGLTCTFDGSTSTDTGGSIATYSWNFNNGPGATGVSPTKTFSAPGTYNVSLTVTDNQGATNTTSHPVTVVAPNAAPTARFTQACTYLNCTLDGTTSSDPNGDTLTYAWEIDDVPSGTTSTITPALAPGTYTVDLTVTDPGTLSHTVTHEVVVPANATPTAAFTSTCSTTGCMLDGTTSSDPEGEALSYAWKIDGVDAGTTATISPTLPPGPHSVELTVTDPGTLENTVTQEVTVQENVAPVAAFTSSCTALVCSFDASTSTDANNNIVSRTWDFGDGTDPVEGAVVQHTYGSAGDWAVTLVVTDSGALSDDAGDTVTVTEPAASNIAFVGQTSVSGNVTTHQANVPAGVQAGDALLMFFSGGTSPTTVDPPAGVTGWSQLDVLTNASGTTRVWRKVAAASDAGAQVRITMSALTKGNLMIVAYRGTSAVDPIATFARVAATTSSATRTTPTVTVVGSTSWVVSYWMHRDSSSTSLSVPASVTSRSTGTQSGGGRVTTLLADSNAAVPAGSYGGLSATAQAASSFGTAWTIVLAPA